MEGSPTTDDRTRNIAGAASHIVTKSLLQSQNEHGNNFVFSPLGFSSILAILNEGARGETAEQLHQALQMSRSIEDIRYAYKNVLSGLTNSNAQIAPQFKTWLYVYENSSVKPEFKAIVQEYYAVEVKDIKRFDSEPEEIEEPSSTPYELLFPDEIKAKANSTDVGGSFNKLKEEIVKAEENIQNYKEASKFDRNIEDKQYVEVCIKFCFF